MVLGILKLICMLILLERTHFLRTDKLGTSCLFLLASLVCLTQAAKILSWADMSASFFCKAKSQIDGNSS